MLSTAFVAFALSTFHIGYTTAHGGVIGYSINGVYYAGFKAYNTPVGQSSIQREWDSYNPLTDVSSSYLSCNENGAALTLQEYATVPAGTAVTAYWNNPWPHNIGPVLTYMANCNGDCTTAVTSNLEWFKIAASGLISGVQDGGTWAQGVLISQNSSWTTTIPSNLAPGNYLFRNELIALHTANQPQFYPECAQFKVTGSGTGVPSGSYLTKFPGAYSMSDPGINIDIYTQAGSTETNYTIPGPPVWT